MKNIVLFFTSLTLIIFLNGCGESNEAKTIIQDSGSFEELKKKSDKNFSLTTTDGKTINMNLENTVLSSKELNGKFVLINFWGSWCKPCLDEMPVLNHLYKNYSDKLEIVGVLFRDPIKPDALAKFMKEYKMEFPVTVGEDNKRLAYYFDDIQMVPESYLFDDKGKLLKKFIGIIDEKAVESHLK